MVIKIPATTVLVALLRLMEKSLTDEELAWLICEPKDLWVFDKLIVSKKLGYRCGPKGLDVPKRGYYVVRPCVNAMGMGEGVSIEYLKDNTDHLPTGSFWCQKFKGRHLSVDYYKGEQVLCVEGFKAKDELRKWDMWMKVNDKIKLPKMLRKLAKKYLYMNVEYIGGKVIEVHLRHNPDFSRHQSDIVIPVWRGEEVCPPKGMSYLYAPDGDRKGFYIE
jgi:hypothetical protein